MSIVRWLVKHKLLLALIYAAINILLHTKIILMATHKVDGFIIAVWVFFCEFPSGLLYEAVLWSLFKNISLSLILTIQGILAITTNVFLIMGLLALIGKIFKVNKKPEVAE